MTHADKSSASAAETTGSNPARTEAKSSATPPSRKRKLKTVLAAKPTLKSATAKRGTKKAKLLALLRRPGGASLDQLQKATGWQAHSVRGFLSGELKNKMGLRVHSDKHPDGVRTYRLASK